MEVGKVKPIVPLRHQGRSFVVGECFSVLVGNGRDMIRWSVTEKALADFMLGFQFLPAERSGAALPIVVPNCSAVTISMSEVLSYC